MAQQVYIKLRNAGPKFGPFTIKDELGNVLAEDVSRETLKRGVSYSVVDEATTIVISSTGARKLTKEFGIASFPKITYEQTGFTATKPSKPTSYPPVDIKEPRACLWSHLTDQKLYNSFYGITEPYILEYPFAYKFKDEILRNVKDYTKVYKYYDTDDGVLSDFAKYELDGVWFNKAILYNGQQNSGILNLVPKPKNNLSILSTYPKYNDDSKDIIYTKSDNFYQYNTFWNIFKNDVNSPGQFIRTCESLSIDKEIKQANMDYTQKEYKKATLRAKDLKVRHILDNRDDVHLVSQFLITPTQVSEK